MYKHKEGIELVPAEQVEGVICEDVALEELDEVKKLAKEMIELCVEKAD